MDVGPQGGFKLAEDACMKFDCKNSVVKHILPLSYIIVNHYFLEQLNCHPLPENNYCYLIVFII